MGSRDIPESFEIALEPEGAALSCRDKLMHVWRECGQPATLRYMVVDCGGGTIDVTVHDLNIASSDVKEVHRATGDAWGGTYVDKHLKGLVERILGDRVSKKLTDDECFASHESASRKPSEASPTPLTKFSLKFLLKCSPLSPPTEEVWMTQPDLCLGSRLAKVD